MEKISLSGCERVISMGGTGANIALINAHNVKYLGAILSRINAHDDKCDFQIGSQF
jgi:hypothetical protein